MKYYKDAADRVYAYEADGSQDHVIPEDQMPITDAEADALRNPLPTLPEQKAAKWEAIKAERDRRIQHGGYMVGAHWYHSDTFSRTQQMGLVMLGASVPAGLQWKTMDGTFVAMTQALAGQVFAAAAASDVAIFGVAETKRAAMEASADPADFDVEGGWPLAFGE